VERSVTLTEHQLNSLRIVCDTKVQDMKDEARRRDAKKLNNDAERVYIGYWEAIRRALGTEPTY
jgi:hypothetical protein